MKFDPSIHHRKSIRLKGYDYSQAGGYFITLVTRRWEILFGEVVGGEMQLNPRREIVCEEWLRSAEIRREIVRDAFVIMPNHIHGIVYIFDDTVRTTGRSPVSMNDEHYHTHGPAPKSKGAFVVGFKSSVTQRINLLEHSPGTPVWHRNYYEHIIRNQQDYERIYNYILTNRSHWAENDEYQP